MASAEFEILSEAKNQILNFWLLQKKSEFEFPIKNSICNQKQSLHLKDSGTEIQIKNKKD